jgi:hypothetical protein
LMKTRSQSLLIGLLAKRRMHVQRAMVSEKAKFFEKLWCLERDFTFAAIRVCELMSSCCCSHRKFPSVYCLNWCFSGSARLY